MQKVDMFKSPVKLFFQKNQFGSRLGGIVTLVFVAFLCVIFYPSFDSFFSFNNFKINISQYYQTPERMLYWDNQQFYIAVQLLNYNGSKRAYDIYFTKNQILLDQHGAITANYSQRSLGEPCNVSEWMKFGSRVHDSLKFYAAQNGTIYCSPKSFNMSMYGRYSTNSSMLLVSIERCHSSDCLTDQEMIDQNIASVLPNIFFPQTNFQFYKKDPIKLFLQEDIFCFSKLNRANPEKLGYQILVSDVFIDDSDVDIWPTSIPIFHQNVTLRGFLIDRTDFTNQVLNDNTIVRWRFRKSSKTVYVTRTIDKIDEVFSYIGGVLGLCLIFGEIIRHYNEKLMSLRLGANIRFKSLSEPDNRPLFKDFSFYNYLRHMVGTLLWRQEKTNLAEATYNQKVNFTVQRIEKMLSIDFILLRLRKCEILLEALAGQNSLKYLTLCVNQDAREIQLEEELEQQMLGDSLGGSNFKMPSSFQKNIRNTVKLKLGSRLKDSDILNQQICLNQKEMADNVCNIIQKYV